MKLRLLVCSLFFALGTARAQSPEDLHAELRQLKATYETAINTGDLSPLASLFDAGSSGVTVDNQAFHSFEELKAIYDRFHAQFPAVTYRIKFEAEPSLLAGDLVVARGVAEEYVKTAAGEFNYPSSWTVVLRRTDSGWKLVRSQATMDPFGNSIVTFLQKKSSLTYGFTGLGAGALLGVLVGLLLARRRKT